MGCRDNLIALLEPMRLYNLTDGDGYAELCAIGASLDAAKEVLANALAQCVPETADEEGLSMLESLFPMVSKSETLNGRRNTLRKLFAVNDTSNGTYDLEQILLSLGLSCTIVEKNDGMAADVIFSSHRGEATSLEKKIAELILPAHIAVDCMGQCVTWNRLQSLYNTFDALENAEKTFTELMELT